ncbi:MAG TPA: hypothetical protein VFI65_01275 [Streptosporangiaceae bacterium]|nr:hypothetical protein [Streptosporangiaceae bacterium]
MTDALNAARTLVPAAGLESAGWLRRTERTQVLRVRATGSGWSGPDTLIVKLFPEPGEAWARESAALIAAPATAPMPELIAVGDDPPVVVMTDAGGGASLADVLLGDDATAAGRGVEDFAAALARLHLHTSAPNVRSAYAAELATRTGGAVAESAVPRYAARAVDDLALACDRLNVTVPDGALSALAEVPDRLGPDGPAALTLADACPDNSIRQRDGYLLIDFEEGEWRHIAWDAAYLVVPWPSCWCAHGLPAQVAGQALTRYRAELAAELPYAASPEFERDLALATVAWDLISASWWIMPALAKEARLRDGTGQNDDQPDRAPTGRAVILHRLGDASRRSASPELAELARRLHAELVRRWGDVPLELAPAWR